MKTKYTQSDFNIIKHIYKKIIMILLLSQIILLLVSCSFYTSISKKNEISDSKQLFNFNNYSNAYVTVNDNIPYFKDNEMTEKSFETYSDLDEYGRCGVAYACIGKDIMPTEKRGKIGSIKPSGWHTIKYNGIIEGNYLYNRCHLIGYQLAGENANVKNLITGTRFLNVEGMLPFENIVNEYVKETGNHVLYRVTPDFYGNNLVCSGVLMEAKSVEDNGEGIIFCVYCFNIQPGIKINYLTGDSELIENYQEQTTLFQNITDINIETSTQNDITYILNTNSKKIHLPKCDSVRKMKESNKKEYTGNIDELLDQGYTQCKNCFK